MKLKIGLTFGGFLFFCFFFACVVGWGMNVYKFTKLDFEAPYKAEVVRGLGVLPIVPMGAIMGYIDIDDTPTVKEVKIVK